MLTATATEFTRDVHSTLMKQDTNASFFQFEAKESLAHEGKLGQQHILVSKSDDKDYVVNEFRKTIKKEQADKPVIIFTEADE